MIETVWQDVRYAIRGLRRTPGFTITAVVVLAFGTGANTSIFALLDELLLRPARVVDSERLVVIRRGGGGGIPYADYRDYESQTRVLEGLAGVLVFESDLAADGRAEFIAAEGVSANYGQILGVNTALGRWFDRGDEPVAVISSSVWQRWFNRDPNILGRRIQSQSQSYRIVAVAPPDFVGALAPMRTDLWIPFDAWANRYPGTAARIRVMLFGRLRPDVSAIQASVELNAIHARLRAVPATDRDAVTLTAEHVRGIAQGNTRGAARAAMTLFTIVVGLILAIACVNVGNLLLVRGAARQAEFAVRRALGASRSRVFRQLLTEACIVALLGGGLGVIVAWGTNHSLIALLPALPFAWPLQFDLAIGHRTLGFATAIALATTLLCGIMPAWRMSRGDRLPGLEDRTHSQARMRGRTVATVGQIAVSLVLLLAAGTFLDGLWRLQATNPGFAVNNRLYATTYVPAEPSDAEASRRLYAQALERVRALPEIQSASITHLLPLSPTSSECVIHPAGEKTQVTNSTIDAGFFSTMRISLIEGRDFATTDAPGTPAVVIVNETLARQFRPGGTMVGQRLLIGCGETPNVAEVVGVVRDSTIRSLGEVMQPHLYWPFAQRHSGVATLVMETGVPPALMANGVRKALQEFGERLRVYEVRPVGDHVERSYWVIRWQARIVGLFALLALGLAAVGLYGVIAYRVTLCTRDFGIRLALGASRGALLAGVIRHGLTLALAGIVLGSAVSVGVSILLARVLAGIEPTTLPTYVAMALTWITVTLLACYVPAHRAARVDPISALRVE